MYRLSVIIFLLLLASAAWSDDVSPDRLIDQATRDLLIVIEQGRGYYDEEPDRFFAEIERVIAPIVDFYAFSRGVMGNWGSKNYYKSLQSDGERENFDRRVERFSVVFRRALIETYGKGLMAFGGERIEVKPVPEGDLAAGNTYVVQLIYPEDSPPHVIKYRMRRDKKGQWRMRNVILDEINLGVVYRNQFAAAVTRHGGDIDKVIDSWWATDGGT